MKQHERDTSDDTFWDAYRDNSTPRKLEEVVKELENITKPETITEKELRPQRVKMKKESTNGSIRDVNVSQDWISTPYRGIGGQVSEDPHE